MKSDRREKWRTERCISPKTAGITYTAALLAVLVATLLFSALVDAFSLQSENPIYLYLSYALPSATLIIAALISLKASKTPFAALADSFNFAFKKRYYIVIILTIVGMLLGLSRLNEWFIELLSKLFGYVDKTANLPEFSPLNVVLSITLIAVIPPLAEEAVFRGIIQGGIKKWGYMAIIITAIAFSLYHLSPSKTLYQFVVGLIFSFIALKCGSVIPTLIVHFLNNLLIILNEYFGLLFFVSDHIAVFTVVGLICLAGALTLMLTDKVPVEKSIEKEQKGQFIYAGAIGFVIAMVLWITNLFA